MSDREPRNHSWARYVVQVRQEADDDTPAEEIAAEAQRRYEEAGGGT